MEFFVYFFEFVSVIICVVFTAVFWVVPIPKSKSYESYRNSVKILSIAYGIIALLSALLLYSHYLDIKNEPFDFLTTFVSSLHAILFTLTLIKLLNPSFNTKKFVVLSIIPIIVICAIFVICIFTIEYIEILNISDLIRKFTEPSVFLRFIFFVLYIFQFIIYTFLFFKEKQKYKENLNNFFADTVKFDLRWVKYVFISALVISLLSMALQLYPAVEFNLFFSILVNLFYFIFAIKYLNYTKLFGIIEPYIDEISDNNDKIPVIQKNLNWKNYREKVIVEQHYLTQGITLEILAQELGIGRTTLSTLINKEEGINFNLWINTFRIEYAKKLFLTNPEYTISQVAELTGFTEASNFSRQFKIIIGESPSLWRKHIAI